MRDRAESAEDRNGVLRLMMKSAMEQMLDTEMDAQLGRKTATSSDQPAGTDDVPTSTTSSRRSRSPNWRNGHSKKTVKGDLGEVTIATPRDRDGSFEPQLIGKHQRPLPGFDEKILALYAKGMTTRDIQELVRELSGVEVAPTRVS